MTYPPGVSFIVPCYNEEKNVWECIVSIKKETLRHPELDTEIIVVDNASTDATAKEAYDAGVIVVFEKTKGIVYARNAGSKQAKYAYMANIDADNRLPRGWLDAALDELENDDSTAIVTGPLVYTDVPRYVNWGANVFYFLARFFHHTVGPTVQGGNYMIKKDVYDQMGGYDTAFEFYGEDTSTAQSATRFGKVKMVPKMWTRASSRRIKAEGLFKTAWTYTINYFWVSFFGRRITEDYKDYR